MPFCVKRLECKSFVTDFRHCEEDGEYVCFTPYEATESPAPSGQAEFDLLTDEIEALKELCKDLLNGADKCGQEPHYIVQPFWGIVKRHAATINKHDLI